MQEANVIIMHEKYNLYHNKYEENNINFYRLKIL